MPRYENNDENQAKMVLVGDALLGSCGSLDDRLQEQFGEDADLMDFDTELLRRLDDHTMQCDECGWWCETSELDDNQICGDCSSGEDDDQE